MPINEVLSSALAAGVLGLPTGLLQAGLPKSAEIAVAAPAKKGWVLYTVQSGDTLSTIAARYGVDTKAIMWSSGIESSNLKLGQTLRIPLADDASDGVRLPPGVQEYTVRAGDTVELVAKRFDLTPLGLVSANPGIDSLDRLDAGSTLYIPTAEAGLILQLKKGETIKDVAARFGLAVARVAKANALKSPTEVSVGDLILLPGVQAKTTYNKLLELQVAERKAREEEARRLEVERQKKLEEQRQEAERQARLEAQRKQEQQAAQARQRAIQQQQAQARARQSSSQSEVRRANFVVAAAGYQYPVNNFVITTYFGQRGAYQRVHTGVDLAAPTGTPIYAARAGQVEEVGWSPYGYGLHVMLNHGGSVETLYGHMSRIVARPGQYVERGQLIGYVGSTGWSTGPHCHFEVRVNGVARNPLAYLP